MARGGPLCSALGGVYGCRACSPAPAFLEQRQGQRQRQKPQGCGLAGRGGCAGHAVNPSMGARFSHPCEKTVLHSHPAPPSTGSWWPWVGATAFLLPPIAVAAHGDCLGSGGWAAGDRREAGAEREPTGTYLRRVPCSPPARPSQEITALPHHHKKTYFNFLTNSSGVSPAFDRFMVAMGRRYGFSSFSHRSGGARKLSGVGRVGCGGPS